jgi:O-antigen/teichoic acid export membrane protein
MATGMLAQAALIVSGPFVARILGVENRGYLALLALIPISLSILFCLGLPQAVAYFLSIDKANWRQVRRVMLMAFVAQTSVLLPLHYAVLLYYSADKPAEVLNAGYISLAAGPAFLAELFGLAIWQGMGHFRGYSILKLVKPLCYMIFVSIIFLLGEGDLALVMLGWVLSNTASGGIALLTALYLFNAPEKTVTSGQELTIKNMLSFGLKGLVGTFTLMEGFRLDQFAAGLFLSPAALGIYVVGQAFSNASTFIAKSAGTVAFPSVANRANSTDGKRLIWRYFRYVSMLNIGIMTILFLAMPTLIPLFFGEEFSDAVPVAQILVVGGLFASSRRILVEGYRGLGHPHISSMAEISMYPWLFTGGLYLMWQFGIEGLAVGVASGYALALLVACIIGLRIENKSAQ